MKTVVNVNLISTFQFFLNINHSYSEVFQLHQVQFFHPIFKYKIKTLVPIYIYVFTQMFWQEIISVSFTTIDKELDNDWRWFMFIDVSQLSFWLLHSHQNYIYFCSIFSFLFVIKVLMPYIYVRLFN